MISIVIPSRSRIDMLSDVIDNLYTKARYPEEVEIICAFDADDIEALSRIAELPDWPRVRFCAMNSKFGYRSIHDAVNEGCRRATGRLIGTWNDDPVMLTRGWDAILDSIADRFDWAVIQIDRFTQFPFITRKVYDCLGHYSLHFSIDDYITFVGQRVGIEVRAPIRVYHCHSSGDEVAEGRQKISEYMHYSFAHRATQVLIDYDAAKIMATMQEEENEKATPESADTQLP